MTKQFTSDLKLKAVNYYHKINNYVKVCEVFECSERSLKRWVERYNKNKNVNRKTTYTIYKRNFAKYYAIYLLIYLPFLEKSNIC